MAVLIDLERTVAHDDIVVVDYAGMKRKKAELEIEIDS